MPAAKITATDVVAAVRHHFGAEKDGFGPEWAALEEFSLHPGAGNRRADLFLVRAWGGKPKGHERITVEVKVSRSDLLSELAKPQKSAAFRDVSHRFYLATPRGLVKSTDDIPAEWGLLEVDDTRGGMKASKSRNGIRNNNPEEVAPGAFVEAFRRAGRAETRIRSACEAAADDPVRIVTAEKERDAATTALYRAQNASSRDKGRLNDFLREVAVAGGWLCVCGKPVAKPTQYGISYAHDTHADGTTCGETRWSRPQYDLESLAVRLGVTDPDLPDVDALPEMLSRARSMVSHALDRGTDPTQVLRDLAVLLEGRSTS